MLQEITYSTTVFGGNRNDQILKIVQVAWVNFERNPDFVNWCSWWGYHKVKLEQHHAQRKYRKSGKIKGKKSWEMISTVINLLNGNSHEIMDQLSVIKIYSMWTSILCNCARNSTFNISLMWAILWKRFFECLQVFGSLNLVTLIKPFKSSYFGLILKNMTMPFWRSNVHLWLKVWQVFRNARREDSLENMDMRKIWLFVTIFNFLNFFSHIPPGIGWKRRPSPVSLLLVIWKYVAGLSASCHPTFLWRRFPFERAPFEFRLMLSI